MSRRLAIVAALALGSCAACTAPTQLPPLAPLPAGWAPRVVERVATHEPIATPGPDTIAAVRGATRLAATLAVRPDESGEAPKSSRNRRVPVGELHLVVDGATHPLFAYDSAGTLQTDALATFAELMGGTTTTIEPRLLAILYVVGRDFDRPVTVVSGLREVEAASGHQAGHAGGDAVDFYVAGVASSVLSQHCRDTFEHVGVGHRIHSGTIHIDLRDATVHWTDFARPGQQGRERLDAARTDDAATNADPTRLAVHLPPSELVAAAAPPKDSERTSDIAPVGKGKRKSKKGKKYHVVKRGESVSRIAKRYGVDPRDLIKWNKLSKQALIKPGQKLRVRK